MVLNNFTKDFFGDKVVVRRPATKRKIETYKAVVGGNTIFLSVGQFDNGEVSEIFIDLHKEGATTRALFNCIAILTSLALQNGVSLESLVDFFAYMNFEPNGYVHGYDKIKKAESIIDFIFRLLAIEYLSKYEYSDVDHEEYKELFDESVQDMNKIETVVDPIRDIGDAPLCIDCGHITVRNGTCFKCLNCGSTSGCS